MYEFIVEAIAWGGYIGIFIRRAIENVFPPIRAEVIMGIGGVLVARGTMDFWPLILIGTAGATLGNYAWYWVGDKWGYRRLEPLIEKHGRWITVDFEDIEKAARFFQSHGQWVVLVLRFSPFLRTMVSLPAGLSHMSLSKFLAYTFVGAAVWNIALVEGGRRLAPLIERYEEYASWVVISMFALVFVSYIYRVITWKPRQERKD